MFTDKQAYLQLYLLIYGRNRFLFVESLDL